MFHRKLLIALAALLTLGTLSFAETTKVTRRPVLASPTAARPLMDQSRFTVARQAVDRCPGFPYLGKDYEVMDPYIGKRYNCIAHSLGIHDRWVNPETASASNPLARMDQMYQAKGYRRVAGLDFQLNRQVEKVVVYASRDTQGRIKTVTHAAVQERDGTWSSKLGQLPLIRHRTPESVSGPDYGEPVAVYVRPRAA